MKQKRVSLEILRIIAMSMVIFNHTGENGFEMFRVAYGSWLWYFVVLADVVSKAGVPIFFMISGALLLGKDESIGDVLKKRVLRYVAIIILFSFIYYVRLYIKHPEYGFSIKYFITYIYSTPFIIPYWFLYSYLSFLLVLPVIRAVVRMLKEQEYFLLLGISAILWMCPVFEFVFKLDQIAISNGFGAEFVIYPILGYWIANGLSEKWFGSKIRFSVIIVFILNWVFAVAMNLVEYNRTGELSGANIDRFSWIPAICIFYIVICACDKNSYFWPEFIKTIICTIGGAALCTYLFEDMLRSDLFLKIFDFASNNVVSLMLCVPYIICIIVSGLIISGIIKLIPIVRKLV